MKTTLVAGFSIVATPLFILHPSAFILGFHDS